LAGLEKRFTELASPIDSQSFAVGGASFDCPGEAPPGKEIIHVMAAADGFCPGGRA
jgi:hypothetical protein